MVDPSVPVLDLLDDRPAVEWTGDGLALSGSRCSGCGGIGFPYREVCYRCGSRAAVTTSITGTGSLYSWTTVHVSSTRTTPYDVGYVDLLVGDAPLRAFGQLHPQGNRWEIGEPVTVVAVEGTPEEWAFTAARSAS